jgi:hypothetical protein
MTNIYVLQCQQQKYYVGKTQFVAQRIANHLDADLVASAWTSYYHPKNVIRIEQQRSPFDEDRILFETMNEYGIENVRGGSFSKINLDENEINILNRILHSSNNECLVCGSNDHFISECPDHDELPQEMNTRKEKHRIRRKEENGFMHQAGSFVGGFIAAIAPVSEEQKICKRCGRNNHKKKNCFAKTHLNGTQL